MTPGRIEIVVPMRAILALLIVVAFGGRPSLAAAQTPVRPPADTVAMALQTRYDTVQDFSAAFTQTYEGGLLRTTASERGTVMIKKPGKMRWSYEAPERKLFVSDGLRMYSYVPADKQVIVSRVPPDDQAGAPVLFLAGKGNLVRDFDVEYTDEWDSDAPGTIALELTPKLGDPSYDALILVIDEDTLQIQRLVTLDTQGGTSILAFTNIRENLGIADSSFTFDIPRGVDVITNDNAGQ
jgi:outer membrane lipoprotein carrier protein